VTECREVTAVVIMDNLPAQCDVYLGRLHSLPGLELGMLDSQERSRAQRYRLAADRDRFLLGAVLLRAAGSHHLGIRPADLSVDRTCPRCESQHGRPVLAGSGLHASVSHSGHVVAVAITGAGPVGVDVEAGRAIDFSAVTDSVCTPAERACVTGLGDFYAYWTRKEAVLKATGEGLRRPMTDLSMMPPSCPPVLLALGSGPAPACRMADISVGDGYHSAVAVLTALPVAFSTHDANTLLAS
jgi:4'-phosphopantetheinyl transferase